MKINISSRVTAFLPNYTDTNYDKRYPFTSIVDEYILYPEKIILVVSDTKATVQRANYKWKSRINYWY